MQHLLPAGLELLQICRNKVSQQVGELLDVNGRITVPTPHHNAPARRPLGGVTCHRARIVSVPVNSWVKLGHLRGAGTLTSASESAILQEKSLHSRCTCSLHSSEWSASANIESFVSAAVVGGSFPSWLKQHFFWVLQKGIHDSPT